MSKLSEHDRRREAETPQVKQPSSPSIVLESDWDERLAAARAKREKLLKAKAQATAKIEEAPTKPKIARPRFLDESDGFDFSLAKPAMVANTAPPKIKKFVAADALGAVNTTAAQDQTTIVPPKSAGVSLKRVAAVVFTCFFGMGFGMVLSLGAIIALGWVSLADLLPGSPAKSVETTALDVDPPVVHVNAPSNFGSATSNAGETPRQVAALSTDVTYEGQTPRLSSQPTPDRMLRPALTSAPLLDATRTTLQPVVRDDAEPDILAFAFETPKRFVFSPALTALPSVSNDGLPTVPEISNIDLQLVLSPLLQPAVDSLQLPALNDAENLPVKMLAPDLIETAPGDLPAVNVAALRPVPVYYSAISEWSAGDVIDAAKDAVVSPAETPFAIRPAPVALQPDASIAQLPHIDGPLEQNLNLIHKLGLAPQDADRFNIVTFAPTTVTAEALESNATLLTATGFPVASTNRVNFRVSKTHVRYYNREDETVAKAMATEVGGIARDFTTAANRPPAGRVEVWLAGSGRSSTSTNRATSSTTAAQRQSAAKARLQNSLVNRLRRGEHLGNGSQ